MSEHHERAAGQPSHLSSSRVMTHREVAESIGAIARDHVGSGHDSNAPLWAYAHARAAAHFARLHLTGAPE